MRDLPHETAQTHVDGLGLNDLIHVVADAPDTGNGGASHVYEARMGGEVVASVQFQHGPRGEDLSTPGITDSVLLDILLDRLRGFQGGPFRCRENALAITKLEEAHHWLRHRALERHRQGVLGKREAHQ